MSFLFGVGTGAVVIAVAWLVHAKWLSKAAQSVQSEADSLKSKLP